MINRQLPPFKSMVGSLLVAMPEIQDSHFNRSVIYLTHHSQTEGARGIIINKPTDKIGCQEILDQLKMPVMDDISFPPVLIGGPDHRMQGFILHTPELSIYPETTTVFRKII